MENVASVKLKEGTDTRKWSVPNTGVGMFPHCDLWAQRWPCAFYLWSDIQSSFAYLSPTFPYTSFHLSIPFHFLLPIFWFISVFPYRSICPGSHLPALRSCPLPYFKSRVSRSFLRTPSRKPVGIDLIDWTYWQYVTGARRSDESVQTDLFPAGRNAVPSLFVKCQSSTDSKQFAKETKKTPVCLEVSVPT